MRNAMRIGWLLAALLVTACGVNPSNRAGSIPALDQTYTSGDGALSFSYPNGWVVREETGQIFLGTSAEALADTSGSATATPGQFVVGIIVFPLDDVTGLSADSSPREVLDVFARFISGASQTAGDPNVPTFGDATDLTIGSRRAARAGGTSGTDQALLIALELDTGVYAILAGGSAPGELARFEPTLHAIAATMRYSDGAPTQPPAQMTEDAGS